jgi:hypothetical protein
MGKYYFSFLQTFLIANEGSELDELLPPFWIDVSVREPSIIFLQMWSLMY